MDSWLKRYQFWIKLILGQVIIFFAARQYGILQVVAIIMISDLIYDIRSKINEPRR